MVLSNNVSLFNWLSVITMKCWLNVFNYVVEMVHSLLCTEDNSERSFVAVNICSLIHFRVQIGMRSQERENSGGQISNMARCDRPIASLFKSVTSIRGKKRVCVSKNYSKATY